MTHRSSSKRVLVDLALDELEIAIEALSAGPDPEMYDFGPAFEMDREAWRKLASKLTKLRDPNHRA